MACDLRKAPGRRNQYGRKCILSASVNQVSGCCQDFVVVIVVTDSSSSRVMRYDAFGSNASRSRFLSGETLPTMRQHSSLFYVQRSRASSHKSLYTLVGCRSLNVFSVRSSCA